MLQPAFRRHKTDGLSMPRRGEQRKPKTGGTRMGGAVGGGGGREAAASSEGLGSGQVRSILSRGLKPLAWRGAVRRVRSATSGSIAVVRRHDAGRESHSRRA